MKPIYHIVPDHGFLNDPNGLSYYQNQYHVFYQWLEEVKPQGSKSWRHCVSSDLIHWTDCGCALSPTEWYEKNGCYSGSAVEKDGVLHLFYTGNVKDQQGNRETYQCEAVSEDGIHFEKKGPVVYLPEGYTPHFRDPKVWKHDGCYYMLIGAQTKNLTGNAALYTSPDLKQWSLLGSLLDESLDWGYMCECPDVATLDGEAYLIVSRQKEEACRCISLHGQMDYEAGRFHVDTSTERLLDEGFDFYAPQTFVDAKGRTLLFAWLGAGEIDYQLSQPAVQEGYLHCLTIPRELFVKDGTLCQRPAQELTALRKTSATETVTGEFFKTLPTGAVEIVLENLEQGSISLRIGDSLSICYDAQQGLLSIYRKSWQREGYDEKTIRLSMLSKIQMFLDYTTAEVFVNDGTHTFTMKAYGSSHTDVRLHVSHTVKLHYYTLEDGTYGN